MIRHPLMLPFPLLALWLGIAYRFGDGSRYESATFAQVREVAAASGLEPMHAWGYTFLLGAVVLTVGMVLDSQPIAVRALNIGGVIYLWWAAVLAVGAATDPKASLTAWAAYGFIAVMHFSAAGHIAGRGAR